MKRRIFSVLLSSALLLTALAGCGQGGEAAPSGSSSDADSETGTRDELIFVNYRDIRDLNPHLYAGEMYAQSILYDTLVSNTEDGYVGCLAEDWTISDDGRIYTFNIRDGVTFSDGTPCDANAILANFNAILENRERHTWLEMMNLLVGVSAPDEDTFVIEMSEPYYPMLTELACIRPVAMISPNCMSDGSTMNGGNGYSAEHHPRYFGRHSGAKGAPARHKPAGHLRGYFLRPGTGSGYPLFPNRSLL